MDKFLDIIKGIGAVASCILGCASVIALCSKSIRKKLVEFVARNSNKDQMQTLLEALKAEVVAMHDETNENIAQIRAENAAQTKKLDDLQQAMDREREASKASLGNAIKQIYYQYYEVKKLPLHEVEALYLAHAAYKGEGGNSFVDGIFDEMINEWIHVP